MAHDAGDAAAGATPPRTTPPPSATTTATSGDELTVTIRMHDPHGEHRVKVTKTVRLGAMNRFDALDARVAAWDARARRSMCDVVRARRLAARGARDDGDAKSARRESKGRARRDPRETRFSSLRNRVDVDVARDSRARGVCVCVSRRSC